MAMLPIEGILFYLWFVPLTIWSTVWKGIALWKCSKNNQLRWFVVLLIVNLAGIPEIIYILKFQKKNKNAYFWPKK